MKPISQISLLVAIAAMMLSLTPRLQAGDRSRRFRRPIRINIGGINIEIGRKRDGRRGVRVDVPQGGVHVDVNTDQVRHGGGVHVIQGGISYWGDGMLPTQPLAPPMSEPSQIELGTPSGFDEPFNLDAPVQESQGQKNIVPPAPAPTTNEQNVPPAPTATDDDSPATATIIRQRKS